MSVLRGDIFLLLADTLFSENLFRTWHKNETSYEPRPSGSEGQHTPPDGRGSYELRWAALITLAKLASAWRFVLDRLALFGYGIHSQFYCVEPLCVPGFSGC